MPRPLPAASGQVRGSGERLAARLPRCGCGPGGPGFRASQAGVFGRLQPPGREELRPALQHEGGGGGGARGREPDPRRSDRSCRAAETPGVRRDPRRGRHASLRASEPGEFRADLPRAGVKGQPGAGKSRGRRGAGALQAGGGEKAENLEHEGELQGSPQSLATEVLADRPLPHGYGVKEYHRVRL